MPKRILLWSRTEPARTILLVVSFMTMVLQLLVLHPAVSPNFWPVVPNVLLVATFSIYGVMSAWKHSIKHMPWAAFIMHIAWLWSGFARLLFSPDPTLLLWGPFFVVAAVMAVVYLSLNAEKRRTSA